MLIDETFEVIDRLEHIQDRPSILAHVSAALSRFGFTGFALTALAGDGASPEPDILLHGWPQGWFDRYLEAGHYGWDPCANYCRVTEEPFTWEEIPGKLMSADKAARVVAEAGEFGFRQGLCVPLHSIESSRGMSMAGEAIELPPGARRMAQYLGAYACVAAERISSPQKPAQRHLSHREREVLRWTAVGKTAEDIGQILDLSSHTVREHMKNIRRKLVVNNNVHAVVRAIKRGDIAL